MNHKWTCQICHRKFKTVQLIDVWFHTNKSILGRLHGVCPDCNIDSKIEASVKEYILKIKGITNVIITTLNKTAFM